jgi:hypothetical protein
MLIHLKILDFAFTNLTASYWLAIGQLWKCNLHKENG